LAAQLMRRQAPLHCSPDMAQCNALGVGITLQEFYLLGPKAIACPRRRDIVDRQILALSLAKVKVARRMTETHA
jgi:hypothetical protein